MKKIIKIILVFLFISPFSLAQIKGLGWAAKFGAAGGYTPVVIYPNFSVLNSKLAQLGFPSIKNKAIYAPGGGGYFYIMSLKNFRIGGMGFGGSTEEETLLSGFNYESNYHISGGGLTIEYTLPFVKKIGVSLGVLAGIGNIELNLYKNKGSFDWTDFNEFDNQQLSLSSNYYILIPTLNVDIPVNRFIALRGGLGYQYSFSYDWKIHNDQELHHVPDGLNGDSFFFQIGILAGFFAF